MLTVSNTLRMSSATVIVRSGGLFWLKPVPMELLLLCSANAFYTQSLATVFQNGRHLGSHKERRDWPQYGL